MSRADYTIYAVKAMQPWEDEAAYWIPQIYEELRDGRARFGWAWDDLKAVKSKIDESGWDQLDADQKELWKRTSFLLGVKPGDYFVYINMPKWGQCTLVELTGTYSFSEIWHPEGGNDFRHLIACRNPCTFERNALIVPPYLSARLKLQGAWYRIRAHKQFQELLRNLATRAEGRTASARLREAAEKELMRVAELIQENFPGKSLEPFVKKVLRILTGVMDVREGPDKDGADLVIDFESGLDLNGLRKEGCCAVQVKSYEGRMAHKRAIEDIRKAFRLNPNYTCGLIVSTALELTDHFESSLDELQRQTGKEVGLLIGKDLARLFLRSGILEDSLEADDG